MAKRLAATDLIWVANPFERPDARPVIAAARAGALGVLDLGRDGAVALDALAKVTARAPGTFAVRVPVRSPFDVSLLPDAVTTVIVADAAMVPAWRGDGRRIVAEVCSADEVAAALAAGVDGVVAKGSESGGRVGTTGAFVLLQQVRAASRGTGLPVWVQGGIGRHTAAAAIVGGATGVVLDSQTALLKESTLPREVRSVVAAMDGSETRVVGGYRIYTRPDLWVAGLDPDLPGTDIATRLGGDRLADQALPAGQDASFASSFAERYATVGTMVTSLRQSIDEHIAGACATRPLAPGSRMAQLLGSTHPVVQGPMTRVSDRPPFTAPVAAAGGVPFIAAALASKDESRRLLGDVRTLLGDAPFGVGILGFVPKELRDEQFEVLREVKPPVVLISGGRPSQATPLEDVGIKTFLHVPSAGLLERYLKDGARRFIFEGSECGGHIGPRTCFALWEAQVDTLLAHHDDLRDVSVLFAGGIHDERSAAMVATVAAPLAEAGASVGVLMGTAYLFTEEAVATGAIGEEFQHQALTCERTAVVESGAGSVTRCVETPFVEHFEAEKRRLIAEGVEASAMWTELEMLNYGRLRIASKGLLREGDEIVNVTREEQRREGMFMIGDIATLHDEVMTIPQLHAAVTDGATDLLAAVAEELLAEREPVGVTEPMDIAIIGMSAMFPGAPDLETFWANIVNGVNSITEVPAERFSTEIYYDPDYTPATAQKSDKDISASKWGGFVPDIAFDALAYGIPPASLAAIEPAQLLSLKAATDALADAGYADRPWNRDRTAVVFGAEGGTTQSAALIFRALLPTFFGDVPPAFDDYLPKMSEDSFPGLLTNVISGRIANRLDTGGKNLTVDAACASSLAALDAACAELVSGASDMVLCGGADMHNGIHDYLLFTSTHALSVKGQCQSFDSEADGIVLGEGVACLVLKRLADAERDGDRIYSVVKAVQGGSDGRSLGLTAPRQQGQERAVRRAYQQAGLSPADVELIEAHGTGTVVGDRTEMSTITDVLVEAGAARGQVVLGSVKTNIGHTKCTAGLAGLIKVAKSIYHGVLPPTLNLKHPNKAWDAETSPVVFLDESRPWLTPTRVAGVSAFGFGGTNFHAVLTSYDGDDLPEHGLAEWPAELFVFRAASPEAARSQLDALAARLDDPKVAAVHSTDGWRLRDVAAAVAATGKGAVQIAIVAEGAEDLRTKVDAALAGTTPPGVFLADPAGEGAEGTDGAQPTVAFLFPGQGSQRPGMLADLVNAFAVTRDVLAQGPAWTGTMLPPAAFSPDEREAQRLALTDTRVAQPALGLAGLSAAAVLDHLGVVPDMVAGHSYGELVALCVAGAYDEATLLSLSEARAEAILAAAGDDPGAMIAVGAARDRVEQILDGLPVVVANDNHPEQLVLAGPTAGIDAAIARLKEHGVSSKRLPVACAFHSPVVAGAAETLAEVLAGTDLGAPWLPVYSNLTAAPYGPTAADIRSSLSAQVANGVRFTEEIEAMYEAGARVFVEAGPGRTLTGLVDRILGDQPHVAVAIDRPGEHGVTALLLALGRLAVSGVSIDLAPLFEGRGVDPSRWLTPMRAPGWVVNGHLTRTTAGALLPGGVRPATDAPVLALAAAGSAVDGMAGATAAAAAPGTTAAPAASVASDLSTPTATAAPEVPAATIAPAATVATVAPAAPMPTAASDVAPAPAVAIGPEETVLIEYFRMANNLIGSGRDLMMHYLGTDPVAYASAAGGLPNVATPAPSTTVAPVPAVPAVAPVAPAPVTRPPVAPVVVPDSPAALADLAPAAIEPVVEPAGFSLGSREALQDQLVGIVSARTGYPADMLDLDLDVEADLSIDSIKRIEILGELAEEIGLTDGGSLDALEDLVEELASRKTLRGIVDFLFDHVHLLGGAGSVGAAPAPAVAAVPSGGISLGTPEELQAQLVSIVSARTGYPADMLDLDLDVEADLSIDSIKRIEILGELAEEIGLTDGGSLDALEDLVEELASRKTLRGIVDFLFEHVHLLGDTAGAPAPVPATVAEAPAPSIAATPTPTALDVPAAGAPPAPGWQSAVASADGRAAATIPPTANRFHISLREAPVAPDAGTRSITTVSVRGGGTFAAAVRAEVERRGLVVAGQDDDADIAILTDLVDAARDGSAGFTLTDLYGRIRHELVERTGDLVVVGALGGGLGIDPPAPRTTGDPVPLGAGVRGLVKTAAIEYRTRTVRLVDLDPAEDLSLLASTIVDEALTTGQPTEVAWRAGVRRTSVTTLVGAPTASTAPAELDLTDQSVILLTGGARGITARAAIAIAQRSGCRIELVGRSPLPTEDEDPGLLELTDRMELRKALIARGWSAPKQIEKECDRITGARQVRDTLRALAEAGSAVTYHQVDVRDDAALADVVESVYRRHGRLDGIVHGAGMLDDHFIADKSEAEFHQVFSTKVDAARTLLRSLPTAVDERVGFIAFFGSIAGAFGNTGQADYAAANDALDTIAASNADVAGRVVSLDWGPWASEAGMVSDSLGKLFEEAGMGLIDMADGTACLLDEIGSPGDHHQVVVVRCAASTLGPDVEAAAQR